MRNPSNAFHLAIPCRDLDEAWAFYIEALGCGPGTRYEDRITLSFFGDQVVCHLSPDKVDLAPAMYPRHFGLALELRAEFDRVLERARKHRLAFFEQPFVRFAGQPQEHWTFFLFDPSNNLIEFKHYVRPETMY
jgi:extradiol dioxygenase family protein